MAARDRILSRSLALEKQITPMNIQITEIFRYTAALIAGGLIGYVFGTIQQIALRRNEKRQQSGQLPAHFAVA